VPHRTFRRQGVEVHVTTPGEVRPTLDQVGLTRKAWRRRHGPDLRVRVVLRRDEGPKIMSWKDYQ